jgi:hypothetical protein
VDENQKLKNNRSNQIFELEIKSKATRLIFGEYFQINFSSLPAFFSLDCTFIVVEN